MYSKTLILSSQNKFLTNSPRAILTIISGKNSTGKIRLYNLDKLNEKVKLGVFYNDKVLTSSLQKVDDHYEFYLDENLNMNLDVYCALVDTGNNNEVVLCGGSYSGLYFTDEAPVSPLAYIDEEFDDEIDNAIKKFDSIDDTDNSFDNSTTTDTLNTINNILDNNRDSDNQIEKNEFCNNQSNSKDNHCGDCNNCQYKDYFYSSNEEQQSYKDNSSDKCGQNQESKQEKNNAFENLGNSSDIPKNNTSLNTNSKNADNSCFENINCKLSTPQNSEKLNKNDINTTACENQTNNICEQTDNAKTNMAEGEQFLASIIDQLEEMFKEYPLNETLMNIIPNSKIIKVEDSIDNSSYIVGTMYDDDQIKYLIYGVPALNNTAPPKELGADYQWLPLDAEDPLSDGYYLVYTDISTGKTVPIRVE